MSWQQQQHYQQYQHYQQQSQHYGGYGNFYDQNVFQSQAWQAYGFQTPNELRTVFDEAVMSNEQNRLRHAIQTENLCHVMNTCSSIRQYFGISWSREVCAIMLAMLDRSMDGFMQWEEFQELQQCLVAWFHLFQQYDVDKSGKAEANELLGVITHTFKFRLTPEALTTLLKRYSYVMPDGRCVLAFDDFVTLCVRLRALTDAFRKRDKVQHGQETGQCTFAYDDFLRCVMCL